MGETLPRKGFLYAVLNNDKYTTIPLETGQFTNTGRLWNADFLEDANEWMDEIWGVFFQFRNNLAE